MFCFYRNFVSGKYYFAPTIIDINDRVFLYGDLCEFMEAVTDLQASRSAYKKTLYPFEMFRNSLFFLLFLSLSKNLMLRDINFYSTKCFEDINYIHHI